MRIPSPLPGLVLLSTLALLVPGPARAHAVLHSVARARAVVVTATYPDGTPLSFERCRVTPPDTTAPLLVGRTDRRGRVAFVPDRPGAWRVRVWTDDGHGLDITVPVDAAGLPRAGGPAAATRPWRIALGAALLLLVGLALGRRRPPRTGGAA